jgi:hypothetical protein
MSIFLYIKIIDHLNITLQIIVYTYEIICINTKYGYLCTLNNYNL